MPDQRVFGVVIVDGLQRDKVRLDHVTHGQDAAGMNSVAVLSGTLCPEGAGCHWCDNLRDRVRSRRVF